MFQEAYPILIGDLDPSGNLQANIIHAPSGNFFQQKAFFQGLKIITRSCTDNLRTKMMVAIMEGKWQNVQMTADYKVGGEMLELQAEFSWSSLECFPLAK